MPPRTPPPARAGGGLFTGRNIVIGLLALLLLCVCACGLTSLAIGRGLVNLGAQIQTDIPNRLLTEIPQIETQAPGPLQTRVPAATQTRAPIIGLTRLPGPISTPAASDDQAIISQVGNNFMTQLKNSNWAAAYALCTTDLQRELGSAQQLGQRITNGKAQPITWTFQDFSEVTPDSVDAQIDGTAFYTGNRSGTLRLVLDRLGPNEWKISGFNLQPQ